MYKARTYRSWVKTGDLVTFEVKEAETDLLVSALTNLEGPARASVLNYRTALEEYIKENPIFYTSLEPVESKEEAPLIARVMSAAAKKAHVGPMAAVAGAMAELVGKDLSKYSSEVIVENGGDIFIKTSKKRKVGIYAGEGSAFTGKLSLEIGPSEGGLGVCASSGTVSHSLSFGKADAVIIISEDTALADAAATTAGNIVKGAADINKGINLAKSIAGIIGVLIIAQDRMGSWGDIRLV